MIVLLLALMAQRGTLTLPAMNSDSVTASMADFHAKVEGQDFYFPGPGDPKVYTKAVLLEVTPVIVFIAPGRNTLRLKVKADIRAHRC